MNTPLTDAYRGTDETHHINGLTIYQHAAKMEADVAELNQRLIERQQSFQTQVIRIEETWREKLRESVKFSTDMMDVTLKSTGELQQQLATVEKERDEADRRAGAAERYLEQLRQDDVATRRWLKRMKQEWGVHENTTFDHVWAECLALKSAAAAPKA